MVPSKVLSAASNTQQDDNSDRQLLDEPKLPQALADICADSQRVPEEYLRETVVPHGGE